MYKNFKITEQEKKQILESHKRLKESIIDDFSGSHDEYQNVISKKQNQIIASKLYVIGKLLFDLSTLNPKYLDDSEKYREEARQLNDMVDYKPYKHSDSV
jgi:hypothetical protein